MAQPLDNKWAATRNRCTDIEIGAPKLVPVTTAGSVKKTDRHEVRLQTILVPIDFSAAAKTAFRHAIDLAGQYRAKIALLHVVRPTPADDTKATVAMAKRKLAELCKSAGVPGDRCKAMVRTGIPFVEITQARDVQQPDLIVLGQRNSAPLGQLGEGHTLERVVRYATCPVLLVRETGRHFVPMPAEG